MKTVYLPKSEATNASSIFSDVWISIANPALSSNAPFSQIFAKVAQPGFAVCLAKFLLSWLASFVSDGIDYQILIFRYISLYIYEISKK